jgi:hypothetical protein
MKLRERDARFTEEPVYVSMLRAVILNSYCKWKLHVHTFQFLLNISVILNPIQLRTVSMLMCRF